MVPKITDLSKVLEKIDSLSEIIQRSSCSEEEVQKINQAIHELQVSINDKIEQKVKVAIDNQQKMCQVHFDRIIEKLDETVKDVDEYRREASDDKKYYSTINDSSLTTTKNSLNKSIDDLKESFKEYKGVQKDLKIEVNENKRNWKSIIYGALFAALFGTMGSLLFLLVVGYLDTHFKLGLSTLRTTPPPH
jgi:uncharacterized protein YaaW (UPF0174 family)